MDWQLLWESFPLLLKGAVMTLKLTAIGGSFGIILGTLIGLGRVWGNKLLTVVLTVYIEVLRGTPLLVQLMIVAFGIPQILGINYPEFPAAVITIAINSSAYVAEIIRSGIQGVDKGQMEAARTLGMSRGMAFRYVILPQAFKRVIPPMVNEMIALIKESSLVSTVALVELMRTATLISSRTYKPFTAYIGAALVYLVMTLTLSQVAGAMERRLRTSD